MNNMLEKFRIDFLECLARNLAKDKFEITIVKLKKKLGEKKDIVNKKF